MTDYDPQVALDLHTTNGTRHAYHLTYSPPLHPGTDPAIVDMLRKEWLPAVTKTVATSTAGNTATTATSRQREAREPAEGPRRWETFDHRPRFNNNYIGLRNRFALLSEAFA